MSRSDSAIGDHATPVERSVGGAAVWLKRGWDDLWNHPGISLLYGVVVFVVSWVVVSSLFFFHLTAYLFPALAGFLIVGPVLAVGLYDKSRLIENGEVADFTTILRMRPGSATQILFSGVFLCMLILLWMRAAVILYALFFGFDPFPGPYELMPILVTTVEGWALLVVGTAVGGLFAALAFAISVFAIPMLYDRPTDVFTAMAISVNNVWRQLGIMLPWGLVVLVLSLLSLVSGFILMIIIFPLLGHATWHVYRDVCDLSGLD
jgi:uncharacterized membrane protein